MEEKKIKYTVTKEFRDVNDFSILHIKKAEFDVSDVDPERLEWLEKNGYVKKNDK